MSTSAAALSRVAPAPTPHADVPLSVRHPWHRISLLGTLVVVLALPWLTSTGCGGDQAPTTYTGYELFIETLTKSPVISLAPLALVIAAFIGVAASLVPPRAGRRLLLTTGMFVVVTSGSFFTFFAVEGPRVSEAVDHHFGAFAGTGALLALVLDAFVRLILGTREWWLVRRARRAASVHHVARWTS